GRLHERHRLHRHRRDLARAGERLPRYGLPWDRLSRHRHRGTGRPGRYRTRLAGILEQHLDDALGACDHHAIVGDLLDLATAHRVTDRIAADALDRGIFQERAALAALDYDAVENGLHHGRRGCRRAHLAPAGIEQVLLGDPRRRL